ncbi:T9SS type A sorting domain-containing protein [Aquimarina sp. 2201CG1-2-11]|uniref:T9SS type A sorting domain-containing protein n=1 Tax=Aquimarina discodermiae TaxID=3231043 RepID=UPI003462BD2F
MKTKGYLIVLVGMLYAQIILAQEASGCNTISRIIGDSEIIVRQDYSSCNEDVTITYTASNVRIYGFTTFHKDKSLRITPKENQTIRIRPIDLVFEEPIIPAKPGDRTRIGSRNGESKGNLNPNHLEPTIKIYPNPTTVAITIESDYPILHYKIVNTFGVNIWEGVPNNNNIDVNTLPQGMYELILQTNTTTITKTFIKN